MLTGNVNLLNVFSEAFKQRRDYLAMQVEVRVPFELRARSVFFRSQTVSCCVGLQDTLADKSVTMSDELRQALQQFLVMRKDAHPLTVLSSSTAKRFLVSGKENRLFLSS